jgi:hypothetical protein
MQSEIIKGRLRNQRRCLSHLQEEKKVRDVHGKAEAAVDQAHVADSALGVVDDRRDGNRDPKDHLAELEGRNEHRELFGELAPAFARL